MSGKNKKAKPIVAISAGCISGAIEATAVWPMEYIKTQLQLQEKLPGKEVKFNGMFRGLVYTVRTTGFFSLYRGLSPTLLGSIPKAGIRFGVVDALVDKFGGKKGESSPLKNLLAGMGAGVAEAILAVTPIETVKTKLIQSNQGLVSGVKHIIKTEGWGGLYTGMSATILKQASNQGLRFMWFNEYKTFLTKDERPLTIYESFFGGMTAGCFSTLGNNPFDVVKTRMQGLGAKQKYKNTLDCFVSTFKNEGISAFYKGVVPRLGRVVPGQGIIFMSYEAIQEQISHFFV